MTNAKLKISRTRRTTEKCSFAGRVPVLFSYFPFVSLLSKPKRTASGYNQQPRAVDPVLPSRTTTPLITRMQWVFPASSKTSSVYRVTILLLLYCYQREENMEIEGHTRQVSVYILSVTFKFILLPETINRCGS